MEDNRIISPQKSSLDDGDVDKNRWYASLGDSLHRLIVSWHRQDDAVEWLSQFVCQFPAFE